MSEVGQILVVEDDNDLREALCDTLRFAGYEALEARNASQALKTLVRGEIHLVISDVQMAGMDGHELLHQTKKRWPEIPFVLITAYGTVPKAVEAIRDGAADYITKPFEAEVLIEMVNRLITVESNDGMPVVEDPRSHKIAEIALRVAASDATVMISGESGTGKEVYARLIHDHSSRKDKPFVAINCAAIPENMLESILFGYEKGAFTGAYQARAGKFEQANGGTLLLDEISEMDLGLQAKLLRVLQEKEVERLGGNKAIALDVRVLATTNRQLREEVTAGNFREDLYYRLNVFPLQLPPLRDRPLDILPLAQCFINRFAPGEAVTLNPEAEQLLKSHCWMGNVRELENIIQRSLILKVGATITESNIFFEETAMPAPVMRAQPESIELPVPPADAPLENDLKTREQEIIINTLQAENGSRKETAAKLGISPRTLRYKIAKFREQGVAI